MNPRRVAALAALCGTVALESWPAAGLLGFGSLPIENAGASMEPSPATSATAGGGPVGETQPAKGEDDVSAANAAVAGAASPAPAAMPAPETSPVQVASADPEAGSLRSENAAASNEASVAT